MSSSSKDLHGSSYLSSGFWNIFGKNKGLQEETAKKYDHFWDKSNEKNESNRAGLARDLTNAYYDLATDLYEYGWAQSFHFSRFYKGEGFFQSIARHEHFLAHMIGIRPLSSTLDVGCGVGGPAREIARFANCKITGINNNAYQVKRAECLTKRANLSSLVKFEKGDFLNMPFEDNTFDNVYSIEATVHACNFEKVYGEIFRVLKPGGKFGVYEWVMTDKFDPQNEDHAQIAREIGIGNGISVMLTKKDCLDAFSKVGFQIEFQEDLAETDVSAIPWYYPIEGKLANCQTFWDYMTCFRMTRFGRAITQSALFLGEKLGLVAPGTYEFGNKLCLAADSLVAGAKIGIFTPMFLVVGQKPVLN